MHCPFLFAVALPLSCLRIGTRVAGGRHHRVPLRTMVDRWRAIVCSHSVPIAASVTTAAVAAAGSAGNGPRCDTFSGRPRCGQTAWAATSDKWVCDAPQCTHDVLERPVSDKFGTYTCEKRILTLQSAPSSMARLDACRQVAAWFPSAVSGCGLCVPSAPDSTLAAGSGRAEVIRIDTFFPLGPPYLVSVSTPLRLCHGFWQPSTQDTHIDCNGNCRTGKGYCRAVGDLCAPCMLWRGDTPGVDPGSGPGGDDDPNEISFPVCPAGQAQGGPIPYLPEWYANNCADLTDYVPGYDHKSTSRYRRHLAVAPSGGLSEQEPLLSRDLHLAPAGHQTMPRQERPTERGAEPLTRSQSSTRSAPSSFTVGDPLLTLSRPAPPAEGAEAGSSFDPITSEIPADGDSTLAASSASSLDAQGSVGSPPARRRLYHEQAIPMVTPCADTIWEAARPTVYIVQGNQIVDEQMPTNPTSYDAPIAHALTYCIELPSATEPTGYPSPYAILNSSDFFAAKQQASCADVANVVQNATLAALSNASSANYCQQPSVCSDCSYRSLSFQWYAEALATCTQASCGGFHALPQTINECHTYDEWYQLIEGYNLAGGPPLGGGSGFSASDIPLSPDAPGCYTWTGVPCAATWSPTWPPTWTSCGPQ